MFAIIIIILIAYGYIRFFKTAKKSEKMEKSAKLEKIERSEISEKSDHNNHDIINKKPSIKVDSKPLSEELGMQKDIDLVISIIKKHQGRINQLDLRDELPFSEAKVSLIIKELEHKGILEKIKKGRGNILVLTEK